MFLKKRPEKLYSKNVFYNTTIRIVCQAYKVYFFELFFEIFCAVFALLYICYIRVNSVFRLGKNLSPSGRVASCRNSFPLRVVVRNADSSFPHLEEWCVMPRVAFPFGESGA